MLNYHIGDELYEAEFYGELPPNTKIDVEIQSIVIQLLREYDFLGIGDSYDWASEEEEAVLPEEEAVPPVEEEDMQSVEEENVNTEDKSNNVHNLRSNYFKNQLKKMAGKNRWGSTTKKHEEDDDVSEVTAMVMSHPTYNSVKEPMDKHRLCAKRGYMEKIAATHQKKQGEQVNSKRAKLNKPVLDVGNIGLIQVEGNTRAATDHGWLPVMVTSTRMVSPNNIMYKLCTQHGYLDGEFVRESIYAHEHMTAQMLRINPMVPKFGQNLSVAKASALYNSLGGSNFCKCGTNCLKNKKCSCVALGKLCSNKCHKKRKDGKGIHCDNCPFPHG